jgi:hypothetical protein
MCGLGVVAMGIVYRARMEMPPLLVEAFDGDEDLLAWVAALRDSWQRWISGWIMEPKSEEARQRRADQMAERLLLTMEAEHGELPPLFARKLRRTPNAMAGWERTVLNRRRTYLMHFFGTRSAQAREKALMEIVEACAAKGSRTSRASECADDLSCSHGKESCSANEVQSRARKGPQRPRLDDRTGSV